MNSIKRFVELGRTLNEERAEIEARLEAINKALNGQLAGNTPRVGHKPRKRRMSAAARKRISEAAKKRWATFKAAGKKKL